MKKEQIYNIFSRIPTLETERLLLRAMKISDAEDMYSYARRTDVTEYLLWSPHQSFFYTKDYLQYIESRYSVGDFYDWAVVEKSSNRMIGTCGFTSIDLSNGCGEIGYVLNPIFHGKGYATEAAEKVLDFGFNTLELHRIEVRFMEKNLASRRVAEKLGMVFEGWKREAIFSKGKHQTVGVCAILCSEYNNKEYNNGK